MSRGLGVLQREILESLEPARAAQPSYDCGWVLYRRVDMQLIEGVYDLRIVSKYLRAHRQIPQWQGERFAPMFSRAVHGLVARGLLQPVTTVPLVEVRYRRPCDESADIPFVGWDNDHDCLYWRSRQLRFVKRQDNAVTT
jgi:hypothetical protein